MDFIKLFDADNDGKVTHMEWEKARASTVFKDKHWPEYNKNNDEYITVDEAPKSHERDRWWFGCRVAVADVCPFATYPLCLWPI